MKIKRRTNFVWGLAALAVGIIVLLRALDVLPAGLYDIAARAWPALLVLVGLSILLRERVRFGSFIALAISLVLVGGVAVTAFSSRITQQREEYRQAINQPIAAGVNLLRVRVITLATSVEVVRSLDAGVVSGEFLGSTESEVRAEFVDNGDGTANLTVSEAQPNPFPLLEAVGRGRLVLQLPADLPLDVDLSVREGTVTLDMGGLALERLNLDLDSGDAVVTLPEYQPLGAQGNDSLGAFVAQNGDITVRVPTAVAARLSINQGVSGLEPAYDRNIYILSVEGVLEPRGFDTATIRVNYAVIAPRGQILIEAVE